MILRSALFLPASNSRAIAKARMFDSDAVILDLEDAVAPDAKAMARDAAVAAVREGGFGERLLVVRTNGLDTPHAMDDLAALATTRPAAVLIPKVDDVATLAAARAALGPVVPLWAMIETCRGILSLGAIAQAATGLGLAALVAGTNDLAKEMRLPSPPAPEALLPLRVQIVVAARSAGLIALDGVCNALDAPERLAAECTEGRRLGFDGKTLIHPNQIAAANAGFGPDAAEIAWARKVMDAFADPAQATLGAIRLDGQMVERLHLAEAERILARAEKAAG
ncbi:CoA ester lyase [Sphingomonas sp. Sph1(2015)]|jgi:citrate lyase subunit beta/citryl-CoA lyase|uniref:HpcH/HpaI aldolase/citrate lyase family protein n=1 Tax=Sphingomonas sp. Sph1(2015) TaxID=1628084 RepID=UPI0009753D6E|nr:CoA ester lyase [Sphingomonas sp. Sph1(2015)]OMJ31928.1 CoA ester lyase [Sphingomonas sp. Sph1(2015)]